MEPGASSGWQDLLGGLVGVAREYVADGVRVSIKTNYTPEIPVATAELVAGDRGGGAVARRSVLGELLGVKAAVIVRNQRGDIISTFGQAPKTDPVRVIVALALVGGVLFLLVRGALK